MPNQIGKLMLGVSSTHIEVGCAIGWKGGFIYIKFLLLVQKAGKFNTTAFPASWPLSNLLG